MRKLTLTKELLRDKFRFCDQADRFIGAVVSDDQHFNFKVLDQPPDEKCWCGDTNCPEPRTVSYAETKVIDLVHKLTYSQSSSYYQLPELYELPDDRTFFLAGILADAVGVYLKRRDEEKKGKNNV